MLIRSVNRPPMLPGSTFRNLVEHRGVEPLTSTVRMARVSLCMMVHISANYKVVILSNVDMRRL